MTTQSDRLSERARKELGEDWDAQATCALKNSLMRMRDLEQLLMDAKAEHTALREAIDNGTYRPTLPQRSAKELLR